MDVDMSDTNGRTSRAERSRSGRARSGPYAKPGNPNQPWNHDLFPEDTAGGALASRLTGSQSPLTQAARARVRGSGGGKAANGSGLSIKGTSGFTPIVVSNLVNGTSAEDIKLTFEAIGPVHEVKMRNPSPAAQTVSFEVTYKVRAHAEQAVQKFNGALADGRTLSVMLSQRREPARASAPAALPVASGSGTLKAGAAMKAAAKVQPVASTLSLKERLGVAGGTSGKKRAAAKKKAAKKKRKSSASDAMVVG